MTWLAALLLSATIAGAQQPTGSVALGDLVQGLGVNTRVLMIGAHPDDEDTNLISWLARGKHVETAYLSLTRGEGGQNLIGNELGYALGQIRTEELLAARRIDGGRQFFTRAVDFGYSKSLAETEQRWPRQLILKDVVAVIRAFRPHVIVAVWSGTAADGHGHHQYAGVIAKEGFVAAADSTQFPESLGESPVWASLKLYRLSRGQSTASANVRFNVGEYDPLFGRSYAELAALSRSQHSSQGMGMIAPIGTVWDGVTLDTSRVGLTRATDSSIFAGIDTTWARFAQVPIARKPHLDSMLVAIRDAQQAFDALRPERVVAPLIRVLNQAAWSLGVNCHATPPDHCHHGYEDLGLALRTTVERATKAVSLAAGISVEVYAAREKVAARDSVDVTIAIHNRGSRQVEISASGVLQDTMRHVFVRDTVVIPADSTLRLVGRIPIPEVTYPWWLRYGIDANHAVYDLQDGPGQARGRLPREMTIGDDRINPIVGGASVIIGGRNVTIRTPVVHRFADPVRGEQRHPLVGVPRISPLLESSVDYVRANRPIDHTIRVELTSSWSRTDTVVLELPLPPGLSVDSGQVRRVILPPFGRRTETFRVRGRTEQKIHKLFVRASNRGGFYREGFVDIQYPHIRPIRFFQPPQVELSAVNVIVPARLDVAYLSGVGDNVQRMLAQLDVKVRSVSPEAIAMLDPARTSTLVIGPRALEAIDSPAEVAAAIQGFARRGGTVVMQYTQIADRPGILPYPVTLSRPADRVADESAPITILDAAHPLLTAPNRITGADFDGWVQERGLYMPRSFDSRWTPLFEANDPGEQPNRGATLVAPVGKGTFVYTTLSFFRQLPAGNPGAARLFVNLLSARLAPSRVP